MPTAKPEYINLHSCSEVQKMQNTVVPPKPYSAFHKLSFTASFMENRKNTTSDKRDLRMNMLTFPYRLHFSVDIRTRSSRGLIIFMEETSENSYISLHISKGHFVFSLSSGGKRFKLKTSTKYNDGQWHNVSIVAQEPWWNHGRHSACTVYWTSK